MPVANCSGKKPEEDVFVQPPANGGEDLFVEDVIGDDFGNNDNGDVYKIVAYEDGSEQPFGVVSQLNDALAEDPSSSSMARSLEGVSEKMLPHWQRSDRNNK